MVHKERILTAIVLGLLLGTFARTFYDIYSDFRGAKGYIAASGRPVGGDFVCFYLAGQVALQNPPALYDWEKAIERQRILLNAPNDKEWILPYAYPPLFAILFIPLGQIDFFTATLVWLALSFLMGFLSIFFILRRRRFNRIERFFICLSLLAFTPFTLDCLAGGQTSAVGMLIIGAVYYLAKTNREFAAGLVLGLGYYKPPLFLLLAFSYLLRRQWKLLGGALFSGAFLLLLSVIYLGAQGFNNYLEKLSRYVYGRELLPGLSLPPGQGVGILSFLMMNLPNNSGIAWFLYFLFLSTAIFFYWKSVSGLDARGLSPRVYDLSFSLATSLSLLFSIQMLNYDVSILFLTVLLVALPSFRAQFNPIADWGVLLGFLFFLIPQMGKVEIGEIQIKPITVLMILWVLYLFHSIRHESIIDHSRL